jgi:mevalonate kinase
LTKFFSHGKLLITGEYVVLDQALSLAIPTKKGQHMLIKEFAEEPRTLFWKSLGNDGNAWFEQKFLIPKKTKSNNNSVICDPNAQNKNEVAEMLVRILNKAISLNVDFLADKSYQVETRLEFDRSWGLGSSSTLICNIAKWAEVDAFELSRASFGGSGFDIAVGMMGGDILYRSPLLWEGYVYNPPFKEQLFFVHLNKKQNSREGISTYKTKNVSSKILGAISSITEKIITCSDFNEFQKLLTEHEQIIADLIEKEPIKQVLFSDYPFAIKSLGAWGGDFILACGNAQTPEYFKSKGFFTIISYQDLIK